MDSKFTRRGCRGCSPGSSGGGRRRRKRPARRPLPGAPSDLPPATPMVYFTASITTLTYDAGRSLPIADALGRITTCTYDSTTGMRGTGGEDARA